MDQIGPKKKKKLRLTLCQLSPFVGGIEENLEKILKTLKTHNDSSDLILFPELFLCGYPCDDLLLRPSFLKDCDKALVFLRKNLSKAKVLLGHPLLGEDKKLFNVVSLFDGQNPAAVYAKQSLPNQEVFDEKRYFTEGRKSFVFELENLKFGVCICEDVWQTKAIVETVKAGAEVILIFNASPYSCGKYEKRLSLVKTLAAKHKICLLYLNMVGGHDEMVFDGGSFVVSSKAELILQMSFFKEEVENKISSIDLLEKSLYFRVELTLGV